MRQRRNNPGKTFWGLRGRIAREMVEAGFGGGHDRAVVGDAKPRGVTRFRPDLTGKAEPTIWNRVTALFSGK